MSIKTTIKKSALKVKRRLRRSRSAPVKLTIEGLVDLIVQDALEANARHAAAFDRTMDKKYSTAVLTNQRIIEELVPMRLAEDIEENSRKVFNLGWQLITYID